MTDLIPKTTVVDEAELTEAALEPSETFARLLARTGRRTAVGTLGLDAIQKRILERVRHSVGTAPIA